MIEDYEWFYSPYKKVSSACPLQTVVLILCKTKFYFRKKKGHYLISELPYSGIITLASFKNYHNNNIYLENNGRFK